MPSPLADAGAALLRVERELREFIAGAEEATVAPSLLEDIDALGRVGRWLVHTRPIDLSVPLSTGGPGSVSARGTAG